MFTPNFSHKFSTCSPLFIPVHFTRRMLKNFFEWKNEQWKETKELFFCKLNIKDGNVFTQNSFCCLKNQAIFFHRVSIKISLTPPLPFSPPVCFHSLFKELPLPLHNKSFIKKGSLEEMEGVNNNAKAFIHLNIKANK